MTSFVSLREDQATTFLPAPASLYLDSWHLDAPTSLITLWVTSTQTGVRCPVCAMPAERVHSRYTRTLADLPWTHYRVRVQLQVRKWFCQNSTCVRRIFTARPLRAARSIMSHAAASERQAIGVARALDRLGP